MNEVESMIGEDGLDLNDHKAVAKWCADHEKSFDENEKKFSEKLEASNISPEAVLQHDLDLSNLPEEVRKEISDGVAELERLGSELDRKLNLTTNDKVSSSDGVGKPDLDNKYMKL